MIDALLSIFRAARTGSTRTVLGLWGELLLIHAAREPTLLVDAWRETPTAPFDFILKERCIEVKTSRSGFRIHEFSLRQAMDAPKATLLASILVRADAGGCTVMQLARAVCRKLDPERQMKVWRTVVTTLGTDAEWADDSAFDVTSAVQSVRLVGVDLLPSPHISESDAPYITNVHFAADVTALVSRHGIGVDDALIAPIQTTSSEGQPKQ